MKKHKCPKCGERATVVALSDSDQRIHSTWLQCSCGYDQKKSDAYAEKVRQAFRQLTGWKVERDTRIFKDLTDHANARDGKRDASEVAAIFAISIGAIKLHQAAIKSGDVLGGGE